MKRFFIYLFALTYGYASFAKTEAPLLSEDALSFEEQAQVNTKRKRKSRTKKKKKMSIEQFRTEIFKKIIGGVFLGFIIGVLVLWFNKNKAIESCAPAINFKKYCGTTTQEDDKILDDVTTTIFLPPTNQSAYFTTPGAYNRFLKSIESLGNNKKEKEQALLKAAKKAINGIFMYEISDQQADDIWTKKRSMQLNNDLGKIIDVKAAKDGFTLQLHYNNDEKSPTAVPAFSHKKLNGGGYFGIGNVVEETFITQAPIAIICYKYIQEALKLKYPNQTEKYYELVQRAFLLKNIPQYVDYNRKKGKLKGSEKSTDFKITPVVGSPHFNLSVSAAPDGSKKHGKFKTNDMKKYYIEAYVEAMIQFACLSQKGSTPHLQIGLKGAGAFKNPLQAAFFIQTLAYLQAAHDQGITNYKLIFKPFEHKAANFYSKSKKKWKDAIQKLNLNDFSVEDFCKKLGPMKFQ